MSQLSKPLWMSLIIFSFVLITITFEYRFQTIKKYYPDLNRLQFIILEKNLIITP
jgi:hypothetical protein